MRVGKLFLYSGILILSSCYVNTTKKVHTPILGEPLNKKPLFAEMQIARVIKMGQPLTLKFTVYNETDSIQRFCRWHTPFEPLMSKYLEIKDEQGNEALYQAAMAKRIMPPPESSYININGKDSLSATVNLSEAFNISDPSRYTVTYVGEDMSGLIVKKSVSFVYER